MGLFVSIEGIDGAGKTTTARTVAARLTRAGHAVSLIRKGHLAEDHPEVAARFSAIGRGRWNAALDAETIALGELPWILYNASYYAALDSALVTPARAEGAVVIVDGWYYKYALRAGTVGARPYDQVTAYFAEVRRPDIVFLLDLAPEVALSRMGALTENETGNATGDDSAPAEAFMRFQAGIRGRYRELAREHGWHPVPADGTTGAVAARLTSQIAAALA